MFQNLNRMEADSDSDLVERCRRDETSALRELVERFQHTVYPPIARAVPDAVKADQLAQEVFLRVHAGLPYFRGEATLATWIERTVADVCPAAAAAGGERDTPLPAQFALRTVARIRRDRWRREQALDLAFNAAIGLVGLATAALGWYVVDASGFTSIASATVSVVGSEVSVSARAIAPSLPGYLGAAALLGGVMLAWWWAER